MNKLIALSLAVLTGAATARAQVPNATYADAFELPVSLSQPVIRYVVHVDSGSTEGFAVTMVVRNAPDTLRLAIPIWAPGAYRVAAFQRNIRDVAVQVNGHSAPVAREDSSTWRILVPRGAEATVSYRVAFPSAAAASSPNNRSFLRATGGLIDGPATYMYIVGQKLAPAHVRFELPAGWQIATGLMPTSDPRSFAANSYDVLIDSPVMIGEFHRWSFAVDGVPHEIAFWMQPGAPSIDSVAFTGAVQRVVETARGVMGRLPYRAYTFLFVDGAGGGLEHLNSTSIGARSTSLARDPLAAIGTTAHEFFHLWNVKRIRPAVLGPFDYQHIVRTTDLWWSEGVTDYFASEIQRRAGFLDERHSLDEFASLLESFYGNPAHTRIAPERSSWTAWDTPAVNGGYSISYYTQGAILGELLELQLRDATAGARGMDDVERAMFNHYAGARGFTGEDLLHVVNDVCGCDLQDFFQRHVSGAEELDVNQYLALAGIRATMTREPAVDTLGQPLPDKRLGAMSFAGYGSAGGAAGARVRLSVGDPSSAWGRAGILTGDEAVSIDGKAIAAPEDVRAALANVQVGQHVTVEYLRNGTRHSADVTVGGYERTRVKLEWTPNASAKQLTVRKAWLGR